jgi:hypothetical protein
VRRIALAGCRHKVSDAAHNQRFVRHLQIDSASEVVNLITPPELGAIAPRAARMPSVPDASLVIDPRVLETVAGWLAKRGRLGGLTISELALLSCLASSGFAAAIGEAAAQTASEMCHDGWGPMRNCGVTDIRRALRPLEDAAVTSERASEAWVAALSLASLAS